MPLALSCTPGIEPCPRAASSPGCSPDLAWAWERDAVLLQGWLKADTRGALKCNVSGLSDATATSSAVAAKLSEAKQIPPVSCLLPYWGGSIAARQCTAHTAAVCGKRRRAGKVKRKSEKHCYKTVFYKPPIMHRHKLHKLTGVLL